MATPEEFEKFQRHISQFIGESACPVCTNKNWAVIGPSSLLAHNPGPDFIIGGPTFPVIHLVCSTCYFVRSFAWQPILNAANAEKGPGNV